MTARKLKKKERINRPELDEEQSKLLEKFIFHFLPSSEQKRVFVMNSLPKLHQAIDDVFMKQMNFGISEREIIDTFLRLNYGFRTILEPWTKIKIPSTNGFYEHVYGDILEARKQVPYFSEHRIHISVNAPDVKALLYSAVRIPIEHTKEETTEARVKVKMEVNAFFGNKTNLGIEEYVPKYLLSNEMKK